MTDKTALDRQVGGDHYKGKSIQPIEYIHANDIPFAEGNVIKYVTRWKDKNGLADLEKAKHYIELLIDLEQRKIAAAIQAATAERMAAAERMSAEETAAIATSAWKLLNPRAGRS